MRKFLRSFCGLLCLLMSGPVFAVLPDWGTAAYPDLYSVRGMDASRSSAEEGWAWSSTADLSSVEAEPNGTLLFSGGPFGVFLLKEVDGAWKEVWTWETLGFKPGDIASAVAAERDPYGRVDLVLAADPTRSRIFLAEARSHQVKIRWEFPCALPPRVARVCPDTGNFLVLSGPGSQGGGWGLDEVDFRQEKVVWSLPVSSGVKRPYDAVRLRSGWTVVSDLATGYVRAFDKKGHAVWTRGLASTAHGPLATCPLALEKTKVGMSLLVSPSGVTGRALMYRLDATSGAILGRWVTVSKLEGSRTPVPPAKALSSAHPALDEGR